MKAVLKCGLGIIHGTTISARERMLSFVGEVSNLRSLVALLKVMQSRSKQETFQISLVDRDLWPVGAWRSL